MVPSRRDHWIAAGAGCLVFGVYVSLLSKAYVFEGLIRAMPIETGRWVHLFPGNYLLYGPLGLLFHTLLQALGVQQLAVTSLQIMDALIGGVGIGLFFLLQRRLGHDRQTSLSWCGVLAFSLGYWLWSTDAENYILSTVLLLSNFFVLVRVARGERLDPLVLGALHGVAVLGHIVNLLFGGVALWVLLHRSEKLNVRAVLRYLAGLLLVAGGAYLAVIFFVQRPDNVAAAWSWFKGSAGTTGSINLGGAFTFAKFGDWLKMSAHLFGSFRPPYQTPPASSGAVVFLAGVWLSLGYFVAVALGQGRWLWREERTIAGGCLIWLALYAAVFTRWEPWTMVYRISDLVPAVVLLSLAYRGVAGKGIFSKWAPAFLAVCLFVGNGGAELLPRSYATNNPQLARMEFIRLNTPETAWVAGEGRSGEIHLPYFAQRRPIVVDRFLNDPERLAAGLAELLKNKQAVYVPSTVLERENWKTFFGRYRLDVVAHDSSGFTLYRIRS